MIYSFLKSIVRIALKVYFKKIHIKGLENIPNEGPFLVVANHPSSFLDPMSIAVLIPQKISFLAKATMFKNKIVASILRGLNLVPIYRAADNPKMLNKNQEVFNACYKKLANNGVIMIFPEGTSENERKLRKVKTGAARIALGTAKENEFNVNVKILPVGLNYTKSSRFKSEIFIEFGEAIEAKKYFEAYKKDEIETAKELTNDIEKRITELIINIDKEEYEILMEQVETLYKPYLLNLEKQKNPFTEIQISKEIYNTIKNYQEANPPKFKLLQTEIDDYFDNLKEINLTDKVIKDGIHRNSFWKYIIKSTLVLILGFPFWLFGYVNSFIPYKTPRFLALLITKSEAFYGALLMSIGTFSFLFFYSFIIYLVAHFSNSILITTLYAIALPACGFFTIYYARIARKFYYNWKFIARFFSKQKFVLELIYQRTNLIKKLNALQKEIDINQH